MVSEDVAEQIAILEEQRDYYAALIAKTPFTDQARVFYKSFSKTLKVGLKAFIR